MFLSYRFKVRGLANRSCKTLATTPKSFKVRDETINPKSGFRVTSRLPRVGKDKLHELLAETRKVRAAGFCAYVAL